MKALVVGVPDYAHQPVDVVSLVSGATPPAGERPHRRPERQAGPLLRQARRARSGSSASAAGPLTVPVSGVGRNLIGGQVAIDVDAVVLYSTPATDRTARRRARLQQPRVPACRHEQAGGRPNGRAVKRVPARRTRPSRASPTCRRSAKPGELPGQGVLRPARVADERVHGAGAAVGAGADREHDDDADRRAAARDRDDEGDRRDPPPDPPRLPAHRAPARARPAP